MHKVEIFRFTVVSSNMVSKKQSLRFIPSSISLILLSENNRSARITIEKNKIMSIEKVKAYFATLGREKEVMEFPVSSATVELAAQALSVEPARIAKTLSFQGEDENHCILIVTAGDAKIDNSKFRHFFKMKARMLSPEKVAESTGHAIGGVWKSHATLTLLATQDLPTFGYNMIDPLKSWCWGTILFYPFKNSRFS